MPPRNMYHLATRTQQVAWCKWMWMESNLLSSFRKAKASKVDQRMLGYSEFCWIHPILGPPLQVWRTSSGCCDSPDISSSHSLSFCSLWWMGEAGYGSESYVSFAITFLCSSVIWQYVSSWLVFRKPLPAKGAFALAWQKITKVIDDLHCKNHVETCRQKWNPDLIRDVYPNANLVCCEQTFAWLG